MEYLVLTDYRSVYVKFNYLCLNPDKRNLLGELLLSNDKCSVFNIVELKQPRQRQIEQNNRSARMIMVLVTFL